MNLFRKKSHHPKPVTPVPGTGKWYLASDTGYVGTSADAIDWNLVKVTSVGGGYKLISGDVHSIVTVADSSGVRTTNRVNWSQTNIPTSPTYGTWRGAFRTYDFNKIYLVGEKGKIIKSGLEGNSWDSTAQQLNIDGMASTEWRAITEFKNGTAILVGFARDASYTAYGAFARLDLSTGEGEAGYIPVKDTDLYDVMYQPDLDVLIAVGNKGAGVMVSLDGMTWEKAFQPDFKLNSLTYSPDHDLYVACGDKSTEIYYSQTLDFWAKGTITGASQSAKFNRVRYHDGRFVMVGTYLNTAYSDDGIYFTAKANQQESGQSISHQYYDVTWVPDLGGSQ